MDQVWKISMQTWRVLKREAEQCWPNEACGLLVTTLDQEIACGNVRWLEAISVENRATGARLSSWYEIDPRDWMRIERDADTSGRRVVGVWHSHPNGDPIPSRADGEHAFPGLVYLILGMAQRESGEALAGSEARWVEGLSGIKPGGRVTGHGAWVYHEGHGAGRFEPVACELESQDDSR